MDRMLARSAVIAFCALWAGAANAASASESAVPDGMALTGPAATEPQPSDDPAAKDPDIAAVIRNLPANLDGEIRRAQILRGKGDYKEAAKSLSELMIVAPDDPRVVGEFGKVMVQEGRCQDALAFLKRAIELQPGDWTLYSALGIAYDQEDDHAHAKAAYQHALALKPADPTILNNYAVSRMLAGDLDGAQRLMAQAQPGSGDFPKIANNVAMLASMRGPGSIASAPSADVAVNGSAGAPRSIVHVASLPNPVVGPAVNAPGQLGPQVVMQRVPKDPMAGPVATHTPTPTSHKFAAAHAKKSKPVLASKDAPAAPSLRTAAQVN